MFRVAPGAAWDRETDDDDSVEWEGTFDPAGVNEPKAVEVIEGIYQAGLDSL